MSGEKPTFARDGDDDFMDLLGEDMQRLRDPAPTEDAIRHALRGNLCRCTGYQGIVESIRAVGAPA